MLVVYEMAALPIELLRQENHIIKTKKPTHKNMNWLGGSLSFLQVAGKGIEPFILLNYFGISPDVHQVVLPLYFRP